MIINKTIKRKLINIISATIIFSLTLYVSGQTENTNTVVPKLEWSG